MSPVLYCPNCKTRATILEDKPYCFNCCSQVAPVSKEYFDSPEYRKHENMLKSCRRVK